MSYALAPLMVAIAGFVAVMMLDRYMRNRRTRKV